MLEGMTALATGSASGIGQGIAEALATVIRARRQAGYADARKMLEAAPWPRDVDPFAGVLAHDIRQDA